MTNRNWNARTISLRKKLSYPSNSLSSRPFNYPITPFNTEESRLKVTKNPTSTRHKKINYWPNILCF